MKSILIIGLGEFGHRLCTNMLKFKNEIMIVDQCEEKIEDLVSQVTSAQIGDCTNVEVLKSLGIGNFDICFVCIGNNFQSSLEITSLLKELGAKWVVSKANRDIQAKFLLRNGADDVIYPTRDIAEKVAVRYSANHIFDYVELSGDYSIYEIPTNPAWCGKTVKELDVRAKYKINILGTKKGSAMQFMPGADYVFSKDEHLMVIGLRQDIDKILKLL